MENTQVWLYHWVGQFGLQFECRRGHFRLPFFAHQQVLHTNLNYNVQDCNLHKSLFQAPLEQKLENGSYEQYNTVKFIYSGR